MDLHHYRFAHTWRLPIPCDPVFEALRDPEGYPQWWPQIRRLRRIDGRSGEVVARSLLPYDLVFVATAGFEDLPARVIQLRLTGDLEGFCRWTVRDTGMASLVRFEQEVVVHKAALRRVALIARPVLRANHSWMMRGGRRGLRRWLATH